MLPMPMVSRQKKQALKQRKRQKSKTEYELKKIRQQLQHKQRLVDMYRKRLQRATALRVSQHDTPRTKTRKFLRHATSAMIHKSLIFHHALLDQVKAKYKETHEERLTQIVSTQTRGTATLNKIFTNVKSWYQSPVVLPAVGSSDHNTVLLCIHRTGHRGRNGLRTDALRILMAKP